MSSSVGKKSNAPGVQVAALPYRRDGELEIMLLTSRERGRWVIPKGWPMRGRKRHAAAAQEALEEAGLEGRIAREPNGEARPCTVQVYPLEVLRQHKHWREKDQRTCRWFSLEEAAHAVDEPELQDLIHVFGASMGCSLTCEAGQDVARSFAKAADFLADDVDRG